jgi:hypothetical protein
MSLHTKLDTHQRQLKALLEEHTALVESRLASIDARLGGQPAEEVDAYKSEIARLEGEKQELAEKNYSLRATLKAVNYETGSEISKLKSELEAARSQQRYHGCYNVSGRKSHVRDVAVIFVILGGHYHLAELLGCPVGSMSHWRDGNFLPLHHREKIDELLNERGYTADRLLFRKTREPKGE